jgi:uncharacterized protein HemX
MIDSERQEEHPPARDEPADSSRREQTAGGTARGARLVTALALLSALAALVAAGWLWYQGEQRLAAQGERLDTVERGLESNVQDLLLPRLGELETRVSALAESETVQAEALTALQTRFDATRVQISKLSELVEGGRRHWRLLEIESLLLAANERLQLHRDPRGAKQALTLANRRLGALDDPRLFGVREQVVDEIAALEALPDADIGGLALSLAELIERVPNLPLASDVPADYPGADAGEETARFRERPWRHFLDSMAEALQGMVTIRRSDDVHQPLMPPEREFFLYQNLLLKLESARLALLQRKTATYHNAVDTARAWLQTYFDREDARVGGVLESLNSVRKVELVWEAPDIGGSLVALRALMRRDAGLPPAGSGATAEDAD